MTPQDGDILVSKPTATVEHCLSIVGGSTVETCPNHDSALRKARRLAQDRHVDVWLTEDHTHFPKIASCRLDDVVPRWGQADPQWEIGQRGTRKSPRCCC